MSDRTVDGEAAATPALLKRALDNGVEDIRLVDGAEARGKP